MENNFFVLLLKAFYMSRQHNRIQKKMEIRGTFDLSISLFFRDFFMILLEWFKVFVMFLDSDETIWFAKHLDINKQFCYFLTMKLNISRRFNILIKWTIKFFCSIKENEIGPGIVQPELVKSMLHAIFTFVAAEVSCNIDLTS